MSISRQITIFTSAMVVLAMLVLYGISSVVFNKLQQNTAFNYLKTTSYVAEELIEKRLAEMGNSGALAVQTFGLPEAINSRDQEKLFQCLLNLRKVCPYLSFALFLDAHGQRVANFPEVKDKAELLFEDNLEIMRASAKPVLKANTVLPLNSLYDENSAALKRHEIFLKDGSLLQEALTNLTITAVEDSGYLILGEIINNSSYYPGSYSATIDNSFLSISLGDIRICSNISSPGKTSYLGSPIPSFHDNFETKSDYYYGVEYAPIGDHYYFSYKAIRNYPGEIIGYLGVGIPEQDYRLLLKSNRFIILAVILISLPVVLVGSWLFCNRITRPIIASMDISQRITEGDFLAGRKYPVPEHPRSEPEYLIVAINEMADKLRENKTRLDGYVRELQHRTEEATALSNQLIQLNEQLEAKVDARTIELRQTVDALKKSNMVKSRFLANMSHELRTPLTNSITASELLLDEIFGTLNKKQARYIKNILLSSNNLLQLINDILDISKIEAGKTNLKFSKFSVKRLMGEVITLVRSIADQKSVTISTGVKPEGLKVTADKLLLKQVLYNLLSNAIKFSDPHSKIWVRVWEEPGNKGAPVTAVHFSVMDKGIGIKESDLERIFVEFEQVDSSYSREYGGTGLGLPLSRKQVELHGGQLSISSRPGVGTEAKFFIPIPGDSLIKYDKPTGGRDG